MVLYMKVAGMKNDQNAHLTYAKLLTKNPNVLKEELLLRFDKE